MTYSKSFTEVNLLTFFFNQIDLRDPWSQYISFNLAKRRVVFIGEESSDIVGREYLSQIERAVFLQITNYKIKYSIPTIFSQLFYNSNKFAIA